MEIIGGDLLDVKSGVIIHQVNCKGVMGGGIAYQIRNKYPQHYLDYKSSLMKLGSVFITDFRELKIIGMFSQYDYGRNPFRVYTNSEAFSSCLDKINELKRLYSDMDFYMPYGIGCGLANGNWDEISSLIEEKCPYIKVVRYKAGK